MLRRLLLAGFVLSALLVVSNTSAPARLGLPAAHDTPRRAEAASGATTVAPVNNTFDAPSVEIGSPPLNYDFSAGDDHWTYAGASFEGGYATISPSGYIESSAYELTQDPGTEAVRLRWQAPTPGTNHAEVKILDGGEGGEELGSWVLIDCSGPECSQTWVEKSIPILGPWWGKTVTIRVEAYSGTIEVDDVGTQHDVVVAWEAEDVTLASDASHGAHPLFRGWLVSEEFVLAARWIEVDYAFPEVDDHELVIQVWESTETIPLLYEDTVQCSACSRAWTTKVLDVGDAYVDKNVIITFHSSVGTSAVDNVAADQLARISAPDWHSATDGDPFDTTTGQSMHSHTDLLIPGRGVPLEFTRRYLSLSSYVGDLGPHWSHTYSASLRIDDDGSVSVRYAHGGTAYFHLDGGSFTAPPGNYDTLVQNPDDTYTLTTKSQISYDFSEDGRLEYIRDRNDNTTTLAYDGSDRLSSVTDSSDRALTFGYENGNYPDQITSVTDPLASPDTRTVEFAYGAGTGDLVTVTDVKSGTTAYEYDSHRMTSLTDANGHVASRNFYDTANRVAEQWDAEEHVTCIYYGTEPAYGNETENCPGVTPEPDPGQTVVVDPLGHKSTYDFDTSFRTTDVTDALSGVVHYDYDSDNNPTCVTDQEGHKTAYDYDSYGNVTQIIDALNTDANCDLAQGGVDWEFIYTANNDVDLATDPLGRQADYVYDGDGNVTEVIRKDDGGATKARICFTVDDTGLVTELIESTTLTDCTGNTTEFDYDDYGNQTAVTDPRFSGHQDPPQTTFTYDLGGRLLTSTNELGHTTTYAYDAQNNVVTATDNLDNVTTYTYDAKGSLKTVTDANRETVGDAETGDDCGSAGTGNGVDDDSDTVEDDGCPSVIYGYDDADRLVEVIDALGQSTTYGYDDNGNRTSVTDARDETTTYAYDALNRLESVTDPLSRVTSYDYDAAGNVTERTDGNEQTTTYTYDAANRLTDIDYPAGTDDVSFAYDAVGNRETMEDGSGTTSYDYDDVDRLTSVTFPGSRTVAYGYDNVGNRTSITYPGGSNEVEYAYDEAHNLETVTDWNEAVTTYTYDDARLLADATLPNDVVSTYSYDNADRLESLVNEGPGDPPVLISSFSYDMDAVGNRTQLTDTSDVTDYTDYTYDQLYRLRNVVNLESQLDTYHYDEVGNRLWKWDNPSEYDDAHQMESAYSSLDADGDGCTQSEEAALGGVFDPNAYYDVYDVPVPARADPAANGTKTGGVDIGDVMAVLFYVWTEEGGPPNANGVDYDSDKGIDTNGDTVADIPPDGVADGIEYDRSPGLGPDPETGIDPAGPPNSAIDMSDVGAVLAQTFVVGCSGDGAVDYEYDDNGNQTDRGADTFEYDHENRLIEATVNGVTSTYEYNGDGLRVSRTVDGATTDYIWDAGSALPVILQETAAGGTTYYVYGLDLISQVEGETATYYLYDGLGSTSELADGTGSRTGTYRYDVFGAAREYEGPADTHFRFTGEQWDEETDFYYLRARYYDPAIGRFVSQDPWPGLAQFPQSQNPYAYVLNNPVRWVDPWGLCNVEGRAFGTPTPTPVGAISLCGPVIAGGACLNSRLVAPPSGGGWGIDWGDIVRAYRDYHPYTLVYRHLVDPAWDFATTRTPLCYANAVALTGWSAFLVVSTPEGVPLWSGPLQYGAYQALAIRTGAACSVTR